MILYECWRKESLNHMKCTCFHQNMEFQVDMFGNILNCLRCFLGCPQVTIFHPKQCYRPEHWLTVLELLLPHFHLHSVYLQFCWSKKWQIRSYFSTIMHRGWLWRLIEIEGHWWKRRYFLQVWAVIICWYYGEEDKSNPFYLSLFQYSLITFPREFSVEGLLIPISWFFSHHLEHSVAFGKWCWDPRIRY